MINFEVLLCVFTSRYNKKYLRWPFPPSEQKWSSRVQEMNRLTWILDSGFWLVDTYISGNLNTVWFVDTDHFPLRNRNEAQLINRYNVTWLLFSDRSKKKSLYLNTVLRSRLIVWTEYCALIDRDRLCEIYTNLWLVETDHVTWILSSDWPRLIMWTEY